MAAAIVPPTIAPSSMRKCARFPSHLVKGRPSNSDVGRGLRAAEQRCRQQDGGEGDGQRWSVRERLRSPAHDTAVAARRHTVLRSLRVGLLKAQPLEHTPCPGCHRTCTPVCPWRPRTATSEQFRSNNAQTPGKTRHHQGPEDEAKHHARRPCTVCKTSIPSSNPGGASIFPCKIDRSCPGRASAPISIGLRWTTNRRSVAATAAVHR
jgi:hypothetical protein